MSGIEIIAAVVGITDVAGRASSKLWGLFRTWRDAPEDLHRLYSDLARTHNFFGEVREGMSIQAPGKWHDLEHLLRDGTNILGRIERIIDGLLSTSGKSNGEDAREVGKRGRLYWITGARREAARLSKELAEMRSGICRLLITQNTILSSKVLGLIEESHEEIQTHITDSATATVEHIDRTIWVSQKELLDQIERRLLRPPEQHPPPYLESVVARRVPQASPLPLSKASVYPRDSDACDRSCRCECHATKTYTVNLSSLRMVVGSFEVTYRCSSYPLKVCQDRNCKNYGITDGGIQDVLLTYTVPTWLARVTLSLFASSNLSGTPQMNIRVFNHRPNDVFGIARHVQSGNAEAVRWMLRTRQASVFDLFGDESESLLFKAVFNRRTEVVKVLLQAGADPFQDMVGRTSRLPIRIVYNRWLAGGQVSEDMEIASLFPISEYLDRCEYTPLHLAILGVLHIDLSEVLRDPSYAANIDAVGLNGFAPLHSAAIRGDANATKQLLRFGANPNIAGWHQGTPLHFSCTYAKPEVTQLLLRAGANPLQCEGHGLTAIHAAAGCTIKTKSAEILRNLNLLVQYGADVNAPNKYGHTPLNVAALGSAAAVEFLVRHGADPNSRDADGDVALADAILGSKYETAAFLLSQGADVAVYNNTGAGLLHFLASGADAEMMMVFRKSGRMRGGVVSTGAKTKEGKTPMRVFAERVPAPSEELKRAWEDLLESVEGEGEDDGRDDGEEEEFFDAEETVQV
ncbi:ankyrin repeat-containing domain protein [Cercophora newfieldiana]|uniref:Ankyrin repeat-containing domain protein n=1 Tax=Cercophora newfieldiana TaxID=92897 RepID=A0AA39YBZ8_9PEZI|nr:ankyrin repeat-containing domain protein [Cercophora newfieldiana]